MTQDKYYDWQHLIETYKSIVGSEMFVVEIGSSNIKRTIELAKYCKELIGIEKFPDRIPNDSDLFKHNIKIINTDWHSLSKVIILNSIDIIVASHVIEHVKDDIKCLNESFEVLKEGGYLLFNTPNRKRLVRSVIEFFTEERKFPYWEHMREYTRLDLEKLIANSKFSENKAKIIGIVFGIHGMGTRFFIKKVPSLFDKFSNFWVVLIQK